MALSKDDRKHLREMLPHTLCEAHKDALLRQAIVIAHSVSDAMHSGRMLQARAEQAKRLQAVAAAARGLADAIGALDGTSRMALDALLRERPGSYQQALADRVIALVWEPHTLPELATCAELASDQRRALVSRNDEKPTHEAARAVAAAVAQRYRDITGKLPPVAEASWFSGFVAELAEQHGLTIGARIVRESVRSLRHVR